MRVDRRLATRVATASLARGRRPAPAAAQDTSHPAGIYCRDLPGARQRARHALGRVPELPRRRAWRTPVRRRVPGGFPVEASVTTVEMPLPTSWPPSTRSSSIDRRRRWTTTSSAATSAARPSEPTSCRWRSQPWVSRRGPGSRCSRTVGDDTTTRVAVRLRGTGIDTGATRAVGPFASPSACGRRGFTRAGQRRDDKDSGKDGRASRQCTSSSHVRRRLTSELARSTTTRRRCTRPRRRRSGRRARLRSLEPGRQAFPA